MMRYIFNLAVRWEVCALQGSRAKGHMELKFNVKKYYSFAELAERWQCTTKDLIEPIIDGELVASFYLQGGFYAPWQLALNAEGNTFAEPMEDWPVTRIIKPSKPPCDSGVVISSDVLSDDEALPPLKKLEELSTEPGRKLNKFFPSARVPINSDAFDNDDSAFLLSLDENNFSDTPTGDGFRQWINGFQYLILPRRLDAWDCEFHHFADTPTGHKLGDTCFALEQRMVIDDVFTNGVVMAEEVARVEGFESVSGSLTSKACVGEVSHKAITTGGAESQKPPETSTIMMEQTPAKTEPLVNWRHRIQAEAWEHWLRLRASGCNPSVYSICDDMAKWCIKNDIKGGKNKNPSSGTIRNVVLDAGHWTPPPHSVEAAKKYIEEIAQTAQTAQTEVAQISK